jgi:hypothetical protein
VKCYEGRREGHALVVTVNGQPLNPRLDLWNHSPTGFEWGYGGSGPAQLALALLADRLADDELAVTYHQPFKWAVVAKLPKDGWLLTSQQIHDALQSMQRESRATVKEPDVYECPENSRSSLPHWANRGNAKCSSEVATAGHPVCAATPSSR